MSRNRDKERDKAETRKLILDPKRPKYIGGEDWLGYGGKGGRAGFINHLLLDGATMEHLLNVGLAKNAIESHFQSLKTDHDLPVTCGPDGKYRLDREHLGLQSFTHETSASKPHTVSRLHASAVNQANRQLIPSELLTADDHTIESAFTIARQNWNKWRVVFEHTGSIATNPLLADPGDRFRSFLNEYSVARTIRAGTHDRFRRELASSREFGEAIHDDSGHALDKLEYLLRPRYGTSSSPRQIISVLSKVAAFVRPERFVAWDQYGRKGINVLLGRNQNCPFTSYANYLKAFDDLWHGEPGKQIREFAASRPAPAAAEIESRFLRRVLDVYAMKRGQRKRW
jgi:hypothetical protein